MVRLLKWVKWLETKQKSLISFTLWVQEYRRWLELNRRRISLESKLRTGGASMQQPRTRILRRIHQEALFELKKDTKPLKPLTESQFKKRKDPIVVKISVSFPMRKGVSKDYSGVIKLYYRDRNWLQSYLTKMGFIVTECLAV